MRRAMLMGSGKRIMNTKEGFRSMDKITKYFAQVLSPRSLLFSRTQTRHSKVTEARIKLQPKSPTKLIRTIVQITKHCSRVPSCHALWRRDTVPAQHRKDVVQTFGSWIREGQI